MNTEYIKINKEQYLIDVLPEIPTNTILNKALTGLGATYGEIKANRHSIILEPNVPVIVGKCKSEKHKNDNLLGVYEGIYTEDVINYLEKSEKHYKILTTPESFKKVKEAFSELDIDIYSQCFCLFDECQKIVQDVIYRSDIALPIDDFFKFDNKAFVSATPIISEDPRFKEKEFNTIQIVPTYEYKKEMELITTNNILEAIKTVLREYTSFENVSICFFLNSTDTIEAIIKQLGISPYSSVFCSPKSVNILKERNHVKAYPMWDIKKMKTFNFFTSRFYSALDIELETKPEVIMITDLFYAEHSMIDPDTEAIQIIGRFRNGVSSIKHITNTNPNLPVKTKEEIESFLTYHENGYNYLKNLINTCTELSVREILRDILKHAFYHKFIDNNENKNYFALENYKDEAKVKTYYNNLDNIYAAYINCPFFITIRKKLLLPLGDFERLKRERNMSIKEKQKEIVSQLDLLDGEMGNYPNETLADYRDILYKCDPFIVEAYEALGKDKLEELNYSRPKIKEAMLSHNNRNNGFKVKQAVYDFFKEGGKYTVTEIKDELERIYELFALKPMKTITGQTIREFFYVKEIRIEGKRGFLLLGQLI